MKKSIKDLQFLSLLRLGIGESDISIYLSQNEIDWFSILNNAKKQSVIGVIADGINKLPDEIQPSITISRQFFSYVLSIEKKNKLLNEDLVNIFKVLREGELTAVLLKGEVVAQNYPIPNHRQSGDIDLYVWSTIFEDVINWLKKRNILNINYTNTNKHIDFKYNNTEIELHYFVEILNNPKANEKFQKMCAKYLAKENCRSWINDGEYILVPPPQFDILYIFLHLYSHFVVAGVGLRQVCDWILYVKKYNHFIDKAKLKNDLKDLGLLKAWKIFGCLSIKYLGMKVQEFPLFDERYYDMADKVLFNFILKSGNFGQHDDAALYAKTNNLKQRICKFKNRTIRFFKLVRFSPSFVFYSYLYFLKKGFFSQS